MTDLTEEQIDQIAQALAKASGVSDWRNVGEAGEYDSREYWRRLAKSVGPFLGPERIKAAEAMREAAIKIVAEMSYPQSPNIIPFREVIGAIFSIPVSDVLGSE